MAKSEKIKTMEELIKSLAHSARTEKNVSEIKKELSVYDYKLYRGKSLIDPTLTHQNYCLYDKVDEFKDMMKDIYSKKDSVIAYENVLTYSYENPPRNSAGEIVAPREFFEKHLENIRENPALKKHFGTLIAAYVHCDETSIHMHYFTSPIEELKKPKTKETRYYEPKLIKKTGEIKMVQKRKYETFNYQFNAAKMMDRDFFEEMHYDFEEAFKEQGIHVSLITDKVREFNVLKKQLEAEYKEKVLNASDLEEAKSLIHEYYETLKLNNPKAGQKGFENRYAKSYAEAIENLEKTAEAKKKEAQEASQQAADIVNYCETMKNEKAIIDEDYDYTVMKRDEAYEEREKAQADAKKAKEDQQNAEKAAETAKKELEQYQKDIKEVEEMGPIKRGGAILKEKWNNRKLSKENVEIKAKDSRIIKQYYESQRENARHEDFEKKFIKPSKALIARFNRAGLNINSLDQLEDKLRVMEANEPAKYEETMQNIKNDEHLTDYLTRMSQTKDEPIRTRELYDIDDRDER